MKEKLDTEKLKTCPECGGVMLRTSLPSEKPMWECITCGVIEWYEPEQTTYTGQYDETILVSTKKPQALEEVTQ